MRRWFYAVYMLLAILSSNLLADEKLHIAVGEYPPYISEHLKYNGVVARIIFEAFALEGVLVEFKFTNWARSFHLVASGESNAIGPILKNSKRADLYDFSDSLLFETQVFFHQTAYNFDWHSIDDLKDIQIGATIAYSYGHQFDEAAKSGLLHIQRVPSDIQNFKKMFNKRIQIFPQSLDVGYYLLHTEFSDKVMQVTHHANFVNQNHNYLAFSKKLPKNKHYLKLFNRGLKELRKSGKYDQYFEASRRGDYIIK